MSKADEAKELLRYYLGLAGAPTSGDHAIEIDEIVDHIIDAAVERVREEVAQ